MIRRISSAFFAGIVAVSVLSPIAFAQSVMTQHLRESTRTGEARLIAHKSSADLLSLDLVLPLRDPVGLKSFLADLYNPASPSFHHFFTPAEFTARFGPTQAQYEEVLAFARSNGLAVTGGSLDGMEVQVKAPVAAVESALHISMQVYQHPSDNRSFFAPDREPSLNLSFNLWHVSGLDNYSRPHPLHVSKYDYAEANGVSPRAVVTHATTGSGPSSSFLGSDMRAAYYGKGSLTGAGQNLGLLEYAGTNLDDLATYYKNIGQTNKVPITLLSTDGTSTACNYTSAGGYCDDGEQNLDITQAIGMAPGLASLTMYVGSSDTAIIAAMTTHNPLPTTIGCSWGWTPVDPKILDPYFQKMAAQGQNFFAASGDASTWSTRNGAWPADDAYVVSVGGTDLVTSGGAGSWSSETAWVDSGGGISPDSIAIPSWQKLSGVINASNKGSTSLRNGPDVSANANFTFYTCSDQAACQANVYGGTSFAAPMWAAYIALVNQQLVASGKPSVGFLNPTLYAQNITSAYSTNFHDITIGTSGSYAATTGYDLVTGWGSPNAGLLAALTGAPTTANPVIRVTSSSSTLNVATGSSVVATITTLGSGGFNDSVALSLAGVPSGVTATFGSNSIAKPGSGTSTLTFAATSAANAGTYPIVIKAAGGGLSSSTTISLTVTKTAPAFVLAISPSSGTVARGSSAQSLIMTSVSGSFNSSIALTTSGAPSGVTISLSPTAIAAPGSGKSVATIGVGASVVPGTYTITLKAIGGGITHTATLTLTVVPAPAFTFTATPSALSVAPGKSGSATVAVSVSGGFNDSVSLKASGIPSGVTLSASSSSFARPGSGSSVLTFAVKSSAVAGTYPITVSASGGGIVHTATVTLTVTRTAVKRKPRQAQDQ